MRRNMSRQADGLRGSVSASRELPLERVVAANGKAPAATAGASHFTRRAGWTRVGDYTCILNLIVGSVSV